MLLGKSPEEHFTSLSHLQKRNANVKEENFEIKRSKLKKKT